ncbi:hypothetical protein BGZ63DRAFT_166664 [Mariannaea sp. PMI_226]|nr:hypothetical protein BGZ63DRAFT_166664 [Mariannaea sp. PMI_226]
MGRNHRGKSIPENWPARMREVLGEDFVWTWYAREARETEPLDDSQDLPAFPIGGQDREQSLWSPTECERVQRLADMGVFASEIGRLICRSTTCVHTHLWTSESTWRRRQRQCIKVVRDKPASQDKACFTMEDIQAAQILQQLSQIPINFKVRAKDRQ